MKMSIFSLGIGIGALGFLWGTLWMMMCLDYKEQTENLKKEVANYEVQIEYITQVYPTVGGYIDE